MVYKYVLSISGKNFHPESVLGHTQGAFVVDSYFSPRDKTPANEEKEFGYGCISFWHPQKFSTESEITIYEEDFINFIISNQDILRKNGVDDFEIFIEIYFDGGQCNFEIFNKDLLKSISSFDVSLPVSVYVLEPKEIEDWEAEIQAAWKSDGSHAAVT